MNSEEKLLIGLMKGSIEKGLYENIKWDEFTELCIYHRITNFVYERLNKKFVSEKELKKIQEMNKKNLLHNMVLNKEMLSVFGELKRKKIYVIAIKGMALNYLLYSETFTRVSGDIDLLIKEKDFEEIRKLLEEKGYEQSSFWLWKKQPYTQHFPSIIKEVNGFNSIFEAHKELFFPANSFSINLNEIWKDSKKINSVIVPGNEDAVIISVLSAVYQHAFFGMLEALIDVKNLLQKTNQKKLKEKTIKYNAVEPMVYFNELLKEVFEVEMTGIKELEKNSEEKKLSYLRKNSLEKIIKIKSPFSQDFDRIKSKFYWTENFEQKKMTLFFVLNFKFFGGIWKIRTMYNSLQGKTKLI